MKSVSSVFGVLSVSATSKKGGNPDHDANTELQTFGFRPEKVDGQLSENGLPSQGERFVLEVTLNTETTGTFILHKSSGENWEQILEGRIADRVLVHSVSLAKFELVGGNFSKLRVVTPLHPIAEKISDIPKVDPKGMFMYENISINAQGQEVVGEDIVLVVDPNQIRPFTDQPRKYFDPVKLEELGQSILEWGQRRPGIVRLIPPEERGQDVDCLYEIIGGERRWRAIKGKWELLQRRGIKGMKIIVRKGTNIVDQFTAAFMDNHHSEPPTPYENVRAIHWLYEKLKDVSEIKRRTGFSVAKINDYLSLRKLSPEILEMMSPEVSEDKRLRISHARLLIGVRGNDQKEIYEKAYHHSGSGPKVVGRMLRAFVAKKQESLPTRKRDLRKLVARSSNAIIHGIIDLNGHFEPFRSYLMYLDAAAINEIEGALRTAQSKIPRLLEIITDISRRKN